MNFLSIKNSRLSFFAFIFSCVFITSTSSYVKKWEDSGSQALISWDISGYYLYLPGFFYSNLGQLEQRQYIIDTYHPCGDDDIYAYRCSTGKYVIKYSSGMAIAYLPGFMAGHLWAKYGGYPVDGYSCPYQFSMAMYSLLISFLGLWIIRNVLLRHFADSAVALSLVSLCLATNYLNYSAISNMFSHNYLFTIYALIIYLTEWWYINPDYKKSCLLGLLCGLATLIRPTEIISVLIPALWGLINFSSVKERVIFFFKHYKKLFVFGICAAIVGSVQLLYWKINTGHFLYWSYGPEEGFNFLRVPVWNCLFSYKKGWLTYTPWMILSVIGFIPLFVYNRKLFGTIFLFMFLALYITFSWKCWWYGGSFSMRAVVQYYALLIFTLTAFFSWAQRRWYTFSITILFLIFCVWINLVMTYQANVGGGMESDNMNGKYFWKIFGKIHVDLKDRKLIETDEEIPQQLISQLTSVDYKVFCIDSSNQNNCQEFENSSVFVMNKEVEFIPESRIDISDKKDAWFRATCEIYFKQGETNYWNQPLLYLWLTDENAKNIKEKSYRIPLIATYGKWEKYSIDILNPAKLNTKYLKAGIYNPHGDVIIYVKNMRVESVTNNHSMRL